MLEALNPFPRYAMNMILNDYRQAFIAHDCRLLYVIEGSLILRVNEHPYRLTAGDAIYLPAYVSYQFTQPSRPRPRVILVNFDLSNENSAIKDPLAPVQIEDFSGVRILRHSFFAPFDHPLYVTNAADLIDELRRVERSFWTQEPYYRDHASARLKLILLEMLRLHENAKAYSPLVSRAIAFIRENYASDLSNDAIARQIGCHPTYLSQCFRRETGLSLRPFLIHFRLQVAQSLLRMTDEPISAVADSIGFESQAYFTKLFREQFGLTPSAYRAQNSLT